MTDLDDQSVADLRKQMQLLQQTIDKKSKTLKTDDKEFVVDGTQQSQAHTRTLSVSKNNDGSSPVTKTSTVVGNDKHALLDSASKHMGHHTFAEEVKQTMIIGTPSKKEQKKQQKQARKVAMWLEKHELHPCKKWGVVAAKDRIIVPDYAVNAGTDIKWEADPCDIDLKGILTPEEYFTVISTINEAVSHARAKPIDLALAVASGVRCLYISMCCYLESL